MNKTLNTRISLRNDTTENWSTNNPVLLKGEVGIEITSSGANKIKIGDGIQAWNDIPYFGGGSSAVIATVDPTPANSSNDIGTLWINTANDTSYICYDNTPDNAIWKKNITPDDLTGYMEKSQFATNGKVEQGYVDKSIMADSATILTTGRTISVSGDATGTSSSFNGSQNVTIPIVLSNSGVTAGTYTKVTVDSKGIVKTGETATAADITNIPSGTITTTTVQEAINELDTNKQANITGAASSVVSNNLTPSVALISDSNGKISESDVSSTEISYLKGVTGGIQAQIDNIPKYNYQNGTSISISDGSTQEQINTAAIAKIVTVVTSPSRWDAITVAITFTPSDRIKDALYFYNGTSWTFLNYISTGINLANGTTAGIVENSADVTYVNGLATVVQAGKVKNQLTMGSKKFDGSVAVTLLASDIGALTSIPIATASVVGGVKSSSTINQCSIDGTGLVNINSIGVAKLELNGDVLILNGGGA